MSISRPEQPPENVVPRRWRNRVGLLLLVAAAAMLVGFPCFKRSLEGPPVSLLHRGPLAGLTLRPAFPNLRFDRPVFVTWAPDGRDRLFVLEQHGVIHVFDNRSDVEQTEVFLDISSRVSRSGNEEGLLGLAFHPDFAANGRFYVYYSARDGGPFLGGRSVLAEYSVAATGRGDPTSERVLLSLVQPYRNHNGGMLVFGPDRLLYLGLGDGGLWGDPDQNAQNLATLLGGILRIDVDGRDPGLPYAIPKDNPLVDVAGARGELWAWGLRNPWRFSFDRLTGEMWVGDVGQDAWEEIDLVVAGGNYGWPAWEGYAVHDEEALGQAALAIAPMAAHPVNEARSITGGYVYRGRRIRALRGWYIYADYVSGSVWGLRRGLESSAPAPGMPPRADAPRRVAAGVEVRRLVEARLPIASFGEDRHGELLICAFDGQIHEFAIEPAHDVAPMPRRLSDTGLFASLSPLEPVAGAFPYLVNVPLWSDGADKHRFLLLPEAGQLGFRPHGAWEVPVGTRLVKTFSLDTVEGEAVRTRILETRVIRRDPAGWSVATYVWNAAQTDALLLEGSLTRELSVPSGEGGSRRQTWYFPSQADCVACHTRASGFLLGVQTRQLNRLGTDGRPQIETLGQRGLLSGEVGASADLPRHPQPDDTSAPVAARARAYLAANCGFCHMPGAPGNAVIDLRPDVPLDQARLVDEPPGQDHLGLGDRARILAPGHPERSLLWRRMVHRGDRRAMPPLASSLVDRQGSALIEAWIRGLGPAPAGH